jgi:site-specific DNA-methyltransferase (adenine-specific)
VIVGVVVLRLAADVARTMWRGGTVTSSLNPYYEHGGVSIYHGDCRDILPSIGRVDLLLTDPPYGISLNTDNSRFSGGTSRSAARRGGGVGPSGGKPVANDSESFDPSSLLAYGDNQVIWGWNNYPDKLPRGACLVWLKRYDEAFGTFLSDAEIAWMSKGHGVYCRRDLSNASIARKRVHPTQKPESLMSWCMGFFPDATVIADPFMGSGSTLVAAKNLGRVAVGIELEERYCEIAAKRLSQEVLFGTGGT